MDEWTVDPSVAEGSLQHEEFTNSDVLALLNAHWPPLKQHLADGHKVKTLTSELISAGKGFLSNVYRLQLKFDGIDTEESVVLKIPTKRVNVAAKAESNGSGVDPLGVHAVECDVYSFFEGDRVPGMPLVYHADAGGDSQPGVIVLEDLSRKCGTLELSGGATIEQCWSVLRLLARLQIHMEYASKKEWKGRFKEQSHCTTFFDSFFNGFLPLVRKEHPDFIPLIEGMAAISTPEFARYALLDRPLGLEAVGFNHGDCWVNNVLFEKNADGSLTNNARFLLDWQMAFEGECTIPRNPLFDFARFLTIAADAEVRRVVQPTAAERFHEMLTEEKRKATGDPQATVRWRREDLRELFDLAYLQQSTLFLIAPAFTRLAAVEGEAEGVVAARVEKVKLRAKLNCEDVFPLIKKHKLDEKFR